MESTRVGMTENVSVLIRSAAELFVRCDRIKRYFHTKSQPKVGEHQHFARTVCNSLEAIESAAVIAISRYRTHSRTGDVTEAEEAFKNLKADLAKFCEYFAKIHEVLVYLPRPPIPPEVDFCMQHSFGALYNTMNPTTILGSVFNALTYDFFLKITERIPDVSHIMPKGTSDIFIELPISDRNSPLFWPILAHEIGHSIDRRLGISTEAVDQMFKSRDFFEYERTARWCREIAADFIAAKAIGPAPMLALVMLDTCFCCRVPQLLSPRVHMTHPPTRWRVKAMTELLPLPEEFDAHNQARQVLEDAFEMELTLLFTSDVAKKIRKKDAELYASLIYDPATEIFHKLDAIELPGYNLSNASLKRLQDRLRRNLPIGAQGRDRTELNELLDKYEKGLSEGTHLVYEEQVRRFQNLTDSFAEDPADLASIFTAGIVRREEILRGHLQQPDSLSSQEKVREMAEDLLQLDDLIISSIKSVNVHHSLLARMRTN